jgi:hypothetical protein
MVKVNNRQVLRIGLDFYSGSDLALDSITPQTWMFLLLTIDLILTVSHHYLV